MSMDVAKLKIFRMVYSSRSYSQAGRSLGLTQSAVSQSIRALESALGVALFDKADRAQPTAAGDKLYEESGQLLSQLDDLIASVRAASGSGSGTIRIGMIDTAAVEFAPKALRAFKKASPQIRVEAFVKASGELISMVASGDLDCAIAVTNDVDRSLATFEIYADSIVAIVPAGSRFVSRKMIGIKELKGEPLILYPRLSHTRMVIDKAFNLAGIPPTVSMEMHYPAAICSLVRERMGIGLISELSAKENRLSGQHIVTVKELRGVRRIGLVVHGKRTSSPRVKAFMEVLNKMKY